MAKEMPNTDDTWEPGIPFHFVVTNVNAKKLPMEVNDLLSMLDPDGELTKSAKEAGIEIPEDTNSQYGYYDTINSLSDLSGDCLP